MGKIKSDAFIHQLLPASGRVLSEKRDFGEVTVKLTLHLELEHNRTTRKIGSPDKKIIQNKDIHLEDSDSKIPTYQFKRNSIKY